MTDKLDGLLNGLPNGEAQYVRNRDAGNWDVCIFEHDSVLRLVTIATGMDKNIACWFAFKLNLALQNSPKKGELNVE